MEGCVEGKGKGKSVCYLIRGRGERKSGWGGDPSQPTKNWCKKHTPNSTYINKDLI